MEFSKPEKTHIRIASFDIGKKNFAQYIEDANTSILQKKVTRYALLFIKKTL